MKHLILSPGKAGTHSLLKYLKNIFPEDTIYRTHWISSETTNFVAKSGFWNSESINEQIALAKKIENELKTSCPFTVYVPYRNPFEVCLSSIFQNQHIYEIYFGKINSIQIIQKILDRISSKESLFYGLFLNMQIGVGFYEREINNTLCREKKIFLRQGKNSLDNLTVYFLPIDKEEHAIYEDESVGWLNPVLWPKENMTLKKPFGDVYMESLDAVKFSDQAVSEIKKCLLFQLGFSVEYQKKLIKKFKF